MKRQTALALLVRVRERRGQALDRAAGLALAVLQSAQAAECAALEAEREAQAAHAAEQQKLCTLTDCGVTFDIAALLARQHLGQMLKVRVAQQQAEVARRAAETAQGQADLSARRAAVARNRKKIDALGDDLAQVLAGLERTADDLQDEEAEELAIVRIFRQAREVAA